MRVDNPVLGDYPEEHVEARRRRQTTGSSPRQKDSNRDYDVKMSTSEAEHGWCSTSTLKEPMGDRSKRLSHIRGTMANRLLTISLTAIVLPTVIAVPPPRPSCSKDEENLFGKRRMEKSRIPPRDRRRSAEGIIAAYPSLTTSPTPILTPPPSKRYVVPATDEDDATATLPNSIPASCSGLALVEETTLPYYLTQGSDGTWDKQDDWELYGRGVVAPSMTAAATTTSLATALAASSSASFDVTQSLPKGWGSTSNRSSWYAVPLIVVSSVVLALLITAFVSFIVISRVNRSKKLARRRRKAEAEQRAKLRTAGLLPRDDNSPKPSMDGDRDSVLSGRGNPGRKHLRGIGLGGNRIHEWRKGLRRRKKGGKKERMEDDEEVEVVMEDRSLAEATAGDDIGVETEGEAGASTSLMAMTITEVQESPTAEESGNAETPLGATNASPTTPTDPISSAVLVLNLTRNEIEQAEAEAEVHAMAPPMITGGHVAFLPAYRPASIYAPPSAAERPSSVRADSSLTPYEAHAGPSGGVHGEKVGGTAGYYPAPTTIEQEEAVAVASGSHAVEADDHAAALPAFGHVATDDKRVLERLMRDASSMPGSSGEVVSSSAPVADVDEDGFEKFEGANDNESLAPPICDPVARLPAPPKPVSQVSASAILLLNGAAPLDQPYEATSQPDFEGMQVSAPSAPVFDEEETAEGG